MSLAALIILRHRCSEQRAILVRILHTVALGHDGRVKWWWLLHGFGAGADFNNVN